MKIEQYCISLGIKDKKDLSDKQIEEWGRYLSPGGILSQIFILGTELDKKMPLLCCELQSITTSIFNILTSSMKVKKTLS